MSGPATPAGSRALSASAIEDAVSRSGLTPISGQTAEQFSIFAGLLLRWNAKLNLSAIRTSEDILRRHFLESIFCAQQLSPGIGTLLDFGSGAGFPGIPIALCRPEIRVTLGESQGKKAAFLREAVRTLGLNTEVFDQRLELMDATRVFDSVTLRAVDKMQVALKVAATRVAASGSLVVMTTSTAVPDLAGFADRTEGVLPGLTNGVLVTYQRGG